MNEDEERIAFLVELGIAMTEWANVENCLRHAVLCSFGGDDHQALSIGFFSI